MPPRFYAPTLDAASTLAVLSGEEAHHLSRVLRLGQGDRVRLFDGRGVQVMAEIVSVRKAHVELNVLEPARPAAELGVTITVAQSILKSDKMDAVVRDATMMGVARVQPVVAANVAVSLRSLRDTRAVVERWRRVAVASAKQCGRAVVPAIEDPRSIADVLGGDPQARRLMLTEPIAASRVGASSAICTSPPTQAVLLVGPEGGWSAEEVTSAIDTGWTLWRLGETTMRADAAALAALGALLYVWTTPPA